MEDWVVQLCNASVAYSGERVATLLNVDLSVPPGETAIVVGPNGAGKTTLLEAINGLLPLTGGTAWVFGQRMSPARDDLRCRIAYLPQELFFDPETPFLTQDVVYAARFALIRPFHFPSATDRRHVHEALDAVGMRHTAKRPVGRLSGGQQRKVLLARALAQRARLLLLDEPTVNLDPQAKDEVCRLVKEVRAELAATALVVSHEAELLLEDADRVLTLAEGRVVANEQPASASGHAPVGGR